MSLITISETTPNPPINLATGSVATLRGFYSQRFLDSDGVTPVLSGNGQSGFYYEWTCAVNGDDELVIPEMQVRSTDNGIDIQTSLFTGQLYIDGAPSVVIFGHPNGGGWVIPATLGSPITWNQLDIFNQGRALANAPATYLSTADMQTLFQSLLVAAAVGVLGFVSLSWESADPDLPIALEANDPRVGDLKGTLTANVVPVATGPKALSDSLIEYNGTDVSIPTLNYFQAGDLNDDNNGSYLDVNDSLGRANLFAGGGSVGSPASQYAGVAAECDETSATVYLQSTDRSHVVGLSTGVTKLGDALADNNGTMIEIDDAAELIKLTNLPTANPSVAGALWNDGGTIKISAG